MKREKKSMKKYEMCVDEKARCSSLMPTRFGTTVFLLFSLSLSPKTELEAEVAFIASVDAKKKAKRRKKFQADFMMHFVNCF